MPALRMPGHYQVVLSGQDAENGTDQLSLCACQGGRGGDPDEQGHMPGAKGIKTKMAFGCG